MRRTGLSDSPDSSRPSGVSDEQLSAELSMWTGATPALHPVGELLDRHWEAAFTYARLCTDGPRAAGMLTTAAFTRLFGETLRHNGPASAWRPRLLVTVRRIAAEWDGDGRRDLLHPGLRAAARHGGRPAALLLPRPERRLLSGAFQRLPRTARCLLWHAEAESEPLALPAGLLGMDEESARIQLGRAHDRLREECLQLHRELAPVQECRSYLRMLDVTCRRPGVTLDPDLRHHLDTCTHCRYAADQLTRFTSGLGTALAEAVLGWGARDYVAARARAAEGTRTTDAAAMPPAREVFDIAVAAGDLADVRKFRNAEEFTGAGADVFPGAGADEDFAAYAGSFSHQVAEPFPGQVTEPLRQGRRTAGPPRAHGRSGPAPRHAAPRSARKAVRRRHLVTGVLTVSGLVVLPLVLWAAVGADDARDPAPPRGDGRSSRAPGAGATSSAGDPSLIGTGALRGRLLNTASGLCVGLVGGKAVTGAEAALTPCSAAEVQQWTYETDGRLRNAADPDLCLDSRIGYAVRLDTCTGGARDDADDVRYDFTVQGALVPRSDQRLALAPAATDGSGALVVKLRTDDDTQRWAIDDAVSADLRMKAVHWDADVTSPYPTPGARGR
ncbi:ricin-type beta-trefoil lectin domain protein [Streptomyces sp. NPDC052013]|uniref:ricin-type beta-trefoil lectin domain protein n=1 Tax=Streptomyces sp. NPDC052013 TaxID=3365679 RepID=UPI0037D92540